MTESSAAPLPNTELKELISLIDHVCMACGEFEAISDDWHDDKAGTWQMEAAQKNLNEARTAIEALFGRLLSDNERQAEALEMFRDEQKRDKAEIKARGEVYGRMCETLHACCQKHHLGLGGEHVDRLVVEEVDRLQKAFDGEERAAEALMDQRDAAEEAFGQAFFLVTGRSPEWSNLWGHSEALDEIDETQELLRGEISRLREYILTPEEAQCLYDLTFGMAQTDFEQNARERLRKLSARSLSEKE